MIKEGGTKAAIDEIYSHIFSDWQALAPAVCGYVPTVYWQGREADGDPPSDKHWCAVSFDVVDDSQSVLRNGKNRRFTQTGLISVRMFSPKLIFNSFWECEQLAEVFRNSLRSRTDNVWFRNSKSVPVPSEPKLYRFNVTAEYNFDEVF